MYTGENVIVRFQIVIFFPFRAYKAVDGTIFNVGPFLPNRSGVSRIFDFTSANNAALFVFDACACVFHSRTYRATYSLIKWERRRVLTRVAQSDLYPKVKSEIETTVRDVFFLSPPGTYLFGPIDSTIVRVLSRGRAIILGIR